LRPITTERWANLPGSAWTYTIGSFLSSRNIAATGTHQRVVRSAGVNHGVDEHIFLSSARVGLTMRTGVVRVLGSTKEPM